MDGETYAEARDRLAAVLDRLAALAAAREEPRVGEAARSLRRKLAEERFVVVVAGEFKRGKTTFVNALLGADLLPTAVVPLTSIVTAVGWAPEPRARVVFLDGRSEDVPPEELARYITERGNPGNRLRVARAEVGFPAEALRDGVLLVDTPGVGSVYAHNTEAARAFLPEADAAIFLTSADPPISGSEVAFLREVREETARMLFVLNKVDQLAGADREEALAFTADVVARTVGHPVQVHPVSARRALLARLVGDRAELEASGLPAFERAFRDLLLREKGAALLASVAAGARRLLADLRNSVEVEVRSAELPAEELDRRLAEMDRVFEEARGAARDIGALLERETRDLLRRVEADLDAFAEQETQVLLREALGIIDGAADLRGVAGEVSRRVEELLRRHVEAWRAEEERQVGEAFRAATARFVERAEGIARGTIRLCGEALGLELDVADVPTGIASGRAFGFSFFEAPTILGSILPDVRPFLPRRMAERLLRKEAEERIASLVDRHRGRLRWHLAQRLDRARRELESGLRERLEATIQSLRSGAERAREERGRSAERLRALREERERAIAELEDLRAALDAVDRAGTGAG